MKRSFDPGDLVSLPVLDAVSAVALGYKLVTRAKREKLPAPVERSLRRLREAHEVLQGATCARLEPVARVDRRKAHSAEAAAFSALYRWLEVWAQLPEEIGRGKTSEARRIMAVLFGGGLKFLQLTYDAGWSEADDRVRWLDDADAWFAEQGALELLEFLRTTHEKYGEVLGITRSEVLAAPTLVREPLRRFCDRLREYVVQVAASANAGGDASPDVARRLLAPLEEWPSRRARPSEARATMIVP
jgi:hypothetical protein